MNTALLRTLAGAVLVTATTLAAAQQAAYPSKPVKFIIPYPTGAIDSVARMLGDRLSKQWGQSIVVENRAGGSGIPAMQAGRAAPDGYTLLMGASGPMAGNPALFDKLPYDPVQDYVMVSGMLRVPLILVANPQAPYRTLKELLAAAKQAPGKISYATPGTGTASHLTMELLNSVAGIQLVHIPYKGPTQQMTDMVGGHVMMGITGIEPALPMIKAGKLRPLAVTLAERFPTLPDVATVAEDGYPGFDGCIGWGGIIAPLGTPAAVVDKIGADVRRILLEPAFRDQLYASGMVPDPLDGAGFKRFVESEIVKWKKIAKAANVKAE